MTNHRKRVQRGTIKKTRIKNKKFARPLVRPWFPTPRPPTAALRSDADGSRTVRARAYQRGWGVFRAQPSACTAPRQTTHPQNAANRVASSITLSTIVAPARSSGRVLRKIKIDRGRPGARRHHGAGPWIGAAEPRAIDGVERASDASPVDSGCSSGSGRAGKRTSRHRRHRQALRCASSFKPGMHSHPPVQRQGEFTARHGVQSIECCLAPDDVCPSDLPSFGLPARMRSPSLLAGR